MRGVAARLAAAFLFALACAAVAQEPPPILIVDRERVLRDSVPARSLAESEREARVALGEELEALRRALEAEEAEIAALRDEGDKAAFEARVRAFDIRVREARRDSQAKGEALQARFIGARRDLAAALEPVLQSVLEESGATLILDARTVLAARPGADVTEEVIRRFDAAPPIPLPPAQPAEE